MPKLADDLRIIDADTHLTERHDLFTSRAPDTFKDRVPRVVDIEGKPFWVVDDDVQLGPARAGTVIDRSGDKYPFEECKLNPIEWGIEAAWDAESRLAWMDENGFYAQVLYPNAVGIGGQVLANDVKDPVLRQMCVEIYNDAMAELQDWSGNRFIPMPVMPAWDIGACVREAQRCAELGYRGVNMTADPQDAGLPDLGDRSWDPFWEACAGLSLPVHFHIGASQTAMAFYGTTFWPSQDDYVKPAIGGAQLFQNNSRVLLNSAYSGMFDRHPDLKMVSVESGIGWVPFMLEAMDWELEECAPAYAKKLQRKPSEYFSSNWYATFWFETGRGDLQHLVDSVGEDNIMFETDFPHPTCLHPNPVEAVKENVAKLRPETQRKLMGGNAAELYRI